MARRRYMRVGTVDNVFESPDLSGKFSVALLVAVVNDPGREYWIHLTPQDVARINEVSSGQQAAE